jgi:hypothetical protein
MSLLKALLTAAVVWIGRWCAKNWELFLLRILPLAGVASAIIDIARDQAVTFNGVALAICAGFFLGLRQVPALHQQAKANLEAVGHAVAGVGRLLRRLLG